MFKLCLILIISLSLVSCGKIAQNSQNEVEVKNPLDDLLKSIIDSYLSKLNDPEVVPDSTIDWSGNKISLKAETKGISVSGTSKIVVENVKINLFGQFEITLSVQMLTSTGGLNFNLDSEHVWPKHLRGEGQFWGQIQNLKIVVKGTLVIIGPSVKNFDYSFTIGKTTVDMKGLSDDGGTDIGIILGHLNSNGPRILSNVGRDNHETLRKLIQDTINQSIKGQF